MGYRRIQDEIHGCHMTQVTPLTGPGTSQEFDISEEYCWIVKKTLTPQN